MTTVKPKTETLTTHGVIITNNSGVTIETSKVYKFKASTILKTIRPTTQRETYETDDEEPCDKAKIKSKLTSSEIVNTEVITIVSVNNIS
jgi:hypothetical protein